MEYLDENTREVGIFVLLVVHDIEVTIQVYDGGLSYFCHALSSTE